MSVDLLSAAEWLAEAEEIDLPDVRDRWYRDAQDEWEDALRAAVAAWLLWLEPRARVLDAGELLAFPFWIDAEERLARRISGILESAAWRAAKRQALELGEAIPASTRWRIRFWATQEAARQARWIAGETSAAVEDALRIGIEAGLSAQEAGALARVARAFTLNRRFAQAVVRRALQAEPAKRAGVAARYGAKLEVVRRQTIARTLAATGVARGVQLAGDDLTLMGVRLYKTWLTAADERVCKGCAPQHGRTIPYEGVFVTPFGVVWGPPLHQRCRCQAQLRRAEDVEATGGGMREEPF